MIYPDARLEDADWTKQTWDLPDDPEWWKDAPIADLERLATLPAYKAAPDDVRAVIEARLRQ